MRYSMINGETIEIVDLGVREDSTDIGQRWLRFGVTLRDIHEDVVYQTQLHWMESDNMLRRGRRIKPTVPERAISNLRVTPEVYYDNGHPAVQRLEAFQDLFGFLRRRRLNQ